MHFSVFLRSESDEIDVGEMFGKVLFFVEILKMPYLFLHLFLPVQQLV